MRRINLMIENIICMKKKKVREKSRECHNHKPQPFPDTKRKRKPKIPKSTNRTNIRKALRLALSSPIEVIAILKGLKKHKNKMTHGKTYNKSPRRINHKATKSKSNTGTTSALLTRCYTQHALRHYIESEINHIRHFIKISFINKGIEFIDLPSIFRDNNVISALPSFIENT